MRVSRDMYPYVKFKYIFQFLTHFLFLLFLMCQYAVNWCDKLRFFEFIVAVLLPIFVTGQGEAVNSRIVTLTEPTLLYFHFYLRGR